MSDAHLPLRALQMRGQYVAANYFTEVSNDEKRRYDLENEDKRITRFFYAAWSIFEIFKSI